MTTRRTHGSGQARGAAWRGRALALALALGVPAALGAQTADVSVTKTGPSQVDAGGSGTITYIIVTTNNGPATATNVVLSDTLPPTSDFRFVSASRGASRSARRLTWPAVTLASGASVVDTVVITASAAVGTVLPNVAVVSANETDPTPANNVSQVQTLIVDATQIGVSVTPDGTDTVPRLPSNATMYAYAFTVTSTGTVATSFDLLAAVGGTFLTVDSITGTGVTRGAVPDSARLTALGAGVARSVSVWYRVANVAAGSLESLVLRARSVPISTIGDSAWTTVRVVKPALMTVKSVTPAGATVPGAELTYSILVANGGSEQAAGVTVVDSLPAEVEFKIGGATAILPGGVTATVEYSDGSVWGYTPTSSGCGADAGYDRCVRYVRWTLQQPLGAVAPSNSATFEVVARIR